MPLEYEDYGHLNIDIRALPIKAVVSSLDKRLQPQRVDLLRYHPNHFQLGDIHRAPISHLQNCFIYMAMITAENYSSYKEDLLAEIEFAKGEGLCGIPFEVSNKIKFSLFRGGLLLGILGSVLGLLKFFAVVREADLLTKIVILVISLIIFTAIFIIVKIGCWLLLRHRSCLSHKDKNDIEGYFGKACEKTTKTNFVSDVRQVFEKLCEQRTILLVKLKNGGKNFWDDVHQQHELRGKIAEKNGNEFEDVWLLKNIIPFEDIFNIFLIPVIVPSKDITPPTMGQKRIKIKFDVDLEGEVKVECICKGGYLSFQDMMSLRFSSISEGIKEKTKALSWEEIILSLSPPVISLKTVEILYGLLPPEYRMRLDRYCMNAAKDITERFHLTRRSDIYKCLCAEGHLAGALHLVRRLQCFNKIRKTAVFICYDYAQEENLRDRFDSDLKTLKKKCLLGCNKYKIMPISRKPSSDISNIIAKSDIVIVLWGNKTQFSGSVKKEFEYAREKNKPIILLDGRSNPITPLNSSLTERCKCVLWDKAIDIEKVLGEVIGRLLNEK